MSPQTDASMEYEMLCMRFEGTKEDIRRASASHPHGVRDADLCRLHSAALMDLLDGTKALLREREQDRKERIERQAEVAKERRETVWKLAGMSGAIAAACCWIWNLVASGIQNHKP